MCFLMEYYQQYILKLQTKDPGKINRREIFKKKVFPKLKFNLCRLITKGAIVC